VSSRSTAIIVITDTSILINLSHTGHVGLLGKTAGFEFVVPDEVLAEITSPEQTEMLQAALAAGWIGRESISGPGELTIFAELSRTLGSGESSCLALACSRGWVVACDEKRVFLRQARERLGANRVLNTAGLYLMWIRTGLLTVAEADAAKQILETRRFKLAFKSFGDLI
jgi:predicted nucleic acid-binding protein